MNDKDLFLEKKFHALSDKESIYQQVMEWGKHLSPYPQDKKLPKNLVPGCQSQLYLDASYKENKLFFLADSDALISKGLAALLVYYYNGESPEFILTQKPLFLEKFLIIQNLSPTRANGAASLYNRMQQWALHFLTT